MRTIAIAALAGALSIWAVPYAAAKEPHARAQVQAPAGSRFYPQEVEGGVSGNYPFNNQIRKHTDPLNANGGK